MKIWRSLYYHYIHLYRLGLLGSINESIHLQYANTAIPSVYTNRNTHRNFSQKSENHIPLLRLRIFSSLTSFSSSLQGIAQANLALRSLLPRLAFLAQRRAHSRSSSSLSRPQPVSLLLPPPPLEAAMLVAASRYSAKRRIAVCCISSMVARG